MKYDFDKVVPRRGTNSYKWDLVKQDDVIPLWVADMDFAVAPPIQEALRKRMEHPVFGYTLVPDSYYEAVINWFDRRHNWHIEKDWILYTSGVVPAVSCAIKAFTLPGEKVLLQTPAYNCFFSSIRNQGCEVLENELVREGDTYRINFECSAILIILVAVYGPKKSCSAWLTSAASITSGSSATRSIARSLCRAITSHPLLWWTRITA